MEFLNPWYPQILKEGSPPSAFSYEAGSMAIPGDNIAFGHINLPSGIPVRRLPLLYKFKNAYIPSLILRQVCHYLKVNSSEISVTFGESIRLKGELDGIKKEIIIPIDNKGQVRLNFCGPWEDSFLSMNILALFKESRTGLKNFLKESMVFLSDVSSRGKDYTQGIFNANYPSPGNHLTLANMILTGNFITTAGFVYNAVVILILWALLILTLRLTPSDWFIHPALGLPILYILFHCIQFTAFSHISLILEPGIGLILSMFLIFLHRYFTEKKEKQHILQSLNTLTDLLLPARNEPSLTAAKGGEEDLMSLHLAGKLQMIQKNWNVSNNLPDCLEHSFKILKAELPVKDLILLRGILRMNGTFLRSGEALSLTQEEARKIPAVKQSHANELISKAYEVKQKILLWKLELETETCILGMATDLKECEEYYKWAAPLSIFFYNIIPVLNTIFLMENTKNTANDIVHELKNTSYSVNFMLSGLIKKLDMDAATINRLTLITREMSRLYNFSTKHLDLAMLEKSESLKREPLAARQLIEDITDKNKDKGNAKSITIESSIDKELTIMGDPSYIAILFDNILENAIKYSGINTKIRITGTNAGVKARFQITDQGPGFEANPHLQINTKKITSHGIGLKLCRTIAARHKGEILFEKGHPLGTLVTVILPVARERIIQTG